MLDDREMLLVLVVFSLLLLIHINSQPQCHFYQLLWLRTFCYRNSTMFVTFADACSYVGLSYDCGYLGQFYCHCMCVCTYVGPYVHIYVVCCAQPSTGHADLSTCVAWFLGTPRCAQAPEEAWDPCRVALCGS